MNKKDLLNVIVIIVFMVMVLLWLVIIFGEEPYFTIYKEECSMKVNQTIYDECVAKYGNNLNIEGTSYTIQITPTLEDGLILFEFSQNTLMSSLNVRRKIIETKNCINVSLLYKSCEQVEVDYLFVFHTGEVHYEKDLTIEWLDENCECLGSICSNEKCCSGEYKCGDYIVEVKK